MDEDMDSLVRNLTWDLVKFPTRKRSLQNKWVYTLNEEYVVKKWYMTRPTVKGFAQNKGINYKKVGARHG